MIKASLKNYRQSPRKVRLLADVIRGQKVGTALNNLAFTPKRAAGPMKKLIESAVANAKHNHNLDEDNLIIKKVTVDDGVTMKRWRPRAHGRAFTIRKRTSNVVLELDGSSKQHIKSEQESVPASKNDKKEEVKTVKTNTNLKDKK